jgi:integrase
MGRLYKVGKTYYADLRLEGLGRFSLHTADRTVARAKLHDAELGAVRAASEPAKAQPRPLALAIDAMVGTKKAKTAESYTWHAQPILRHFGAALDINELTHAGIDDYVVARRKLVCDHTVQKELVVLRQALTKAKARGECSLEARIVVPAFKADYQPITRWLSPEQFKALLAVAPAHRRSWLMLQVYTSANLSETARLAWEHVDLKASVITVPGTKRESRRRIVPMHDALRSFLEGLDRGSPLVQHWPGVNDWLSRTCKRLKLPHTSTNDLRRTFGSWLIQAGVDVVHVARLMGNSVEMVAKVYGQHSRASLQAAIDKLPAL